MVCGLDRGRKWAFAFEMHLALTTLLSAAALASDGTSVVMGEWLDGQVHVIPNVI